jgi:hypothetical protein
MSRYVLNLPVGYKFVYGFDHALGYWCECWNPDAETPAVEVSTAFDGMSGPSLAGFLVLCEQHVPVPEKHIECALFDLPF